MKALQRELGRVFGTRKRVATERTPTVTPKLLAAAKAANCSVEPIRGGGFNVWPPSGLASDPHEGDHFANDAAEAHEMVRAYAALFSASGDSK
jgi:hypothetical protein